MMSDDAACLANFDGVTRLFPLPGVVFFPAVVQGLHIFEPRYRAMVEDAIAGDRLITLVRQKDGPDQPYLDRPEIEEAACLGRVTHFERLDDGKFNLRLKGIARLRLAEEIPTDKPYRVARAEPVADVTPDDFQLLLALRKGLAEAVLPRFEPGGPAFAHLTELFAGDTPLGALSDMLGFALPIDTDLKQMLLAEPHVHARAELLTQALRMTAPPPPRKFPPDFSDN
jgi:Lon protease-like protein